MKLMEHQLAGVMMRRMDNAVLDECSLCGVSKGVEKIAFPILVKNKIHTVVVSTEYPPYVRRLISRYIHSKSWRKKKKQEKALKQTIHGNRFLSKKYKEGNQ